MDSINRSLYDPRYAHGSGSKANQMRGYWLAESNHLVGKLLSDLLETMAEENQLIKDDEIYKNCKAIVLRLKESRSVADLDAITSMSDEKNFEEVAKAVSAAITDNKPEAGLDRLHTFVTRYLRTLCSAHGIQTDREKPLHSLIGEYIKKLRELGHIQSEMTLRILKTSISNLEAFNDVRNNQSLAHDNPLLNYDEALLIFNHVASSVRFLRGLEHRITLEKKKAEAEAAVAFSSDDIPF
jgi:Abortive infection C-terminus